MYLFVYSFIYLSIHMFPLCIFFFVRCPCGKVSPLSTVGPKPTVSTVGNCAAASPCLLALITS